MLKAFFLTILTLFFQVAVLDAGLYMNLDNFNAEVEFLWWKATCDELDVIVFVDEITGPVATEVVTIHPYDYGWAPGFKIGLNYESCTLFGFPITFFCDYTRLRATTSLDFDLLLDADTFAFITRAGGPTDTFFGPDDVFYEGLADFLYNRVDLGLEASLWGFAGLSFIGSCGFTYLHLSQNLTEHITNDDSYDSRFFKTSYSGYGPMIGLSSYYHLYRDLSLYSGVTAAGLLGSLSGRRDRLTPTSESVILINPNKGRFLCMLEAGITYKSYLREKYPLEISIGWELLYLPEAVVIPQLNFTSTLSGDINLNALIVNGKVCF